jgi:hypothetical protein
VTHGPVLPSPSEQPRVSRRGRILGGILWFGLPVLLIGVCALFIRTGWPRLIVIVLLPFIIGMPAFGVFCRRHGANLKSWDEDQMRLESIRGEEGVAWDDVEWFWKLWLTHKLEGGGKAWIATLVKYRSCERSLTVLLTVSGALPEGSVFDSLFSGKYKTVFDIRIPSKNRAVAN